MSEMSPGESGEVIGSDGYDHFAAVAKESEDSDQANESVAFRQLDVERHETLGPPEVRVGIATLSRQKVERLKHGVNGHPIPAEQVQPNQDALRFEEVTTPTGPVYILAVADGTGGDPAGAKAAQAVGNAFIHKLETGLPGVEPTIEEQDKVLKAAMAHSRESLQANVRAHAGLENGDSTLTGVLYDPANDRLILAHLGNSEAHLIRPDGTLAPLSETHIQAEQPEVVTRTVANPGGGVQYMVGGPSKYRGVVIYSAGVAGIQPKERLTPEQVSGTIQAGLEANKPTGEIAMDIARLAPPGGMDDKLAADATVGLMLFQS